MTTPNNTTDKSFSRTNRLSLGWKVESTVYLIHVHVADFADKSKTVLSVQRFYNKDTVARHSKYLIEDSAIWKGAAVTVLRISFFVSPNGAVAVDEEWVNPLKPDEVLGDHYILSGAAISHVKDGVASTSLTFKA